ncbi:SpoIIE family protein phosphatase [Sphaerisporangium fuscum]|uniref:SpoIIE family protein phosphatase n=1 Tax=Sphaerisporangium fuscum TaxID=2835868 RepID=UPI001BDD9A99|nr:SpoIIE family protein phosphatase [Sphaerisporangium fuscum]
MTRAVKTGSAMSDVRFSRPVTAHLAGFAALVLDRQGCVTHWGDGAARLFGRPRERALGHEICALLFRGTRRSTVRHALDVVMAGGRWSDILPAECSDGQIRDVAFSWEPLVMPGVASSVLVTATDAATLFQAAGTEADVSARQRLALLNEVSSRIGGTLDPSQAAEEFVDIAVPRLADTAMLYVVEGLMRDDRHPDPAADGSISVRRLAFKIGARATDERDWAAAFPTREVVTYGPHHPSARCMSEGSPVIFSSAELEFRELDKISGVLGDRTPNVLDGCSFLNAPLTARGTKLGFISLTRLSDRPCFDEHDTTLAEDLATRAAMCIDNARLYSRQSRTAQDLQQNLAPRTLTVPPGLEIAHRYLPTSDSRVGGDWYDVISLSETRIALVIGDAMGHGAAAAGGMCHLRAAVRAFATCDFPPDEVLRQLDKMAEDVDSIQCATCLYAVIDLDTRTCSLARAGHPPPILLRPDGTASVLELPSGLALGLGDPSFSGAFSTACVDMPVGSTLAFYTDGLVESREQDIDTGIAALRESLSSSRDTLQSTCDSIIDALPRQYDDVALLLTRTTP